MPLCEIDALYTRLYTARITSIVGNEYSTGKNMKVTKIELSNYRRLKLRGITLFSLLLVEDVQLFLGTNGCGKSSVVNEINPLPADKNDFLKGGYKKVWAIDDLGEEYILTSSFDNGQRHSIVRVRDSVELNEGGTVTVQKELVYSLFRETRDIRELLNGLERFTTMSSARKREWLTKLSVVDYAYAISIYKKAGDKLRDAIGFIRNQEPRLVIESSKLLSAEQEKELRDRHAKLTRESQELYLLRNAGASTIGETKDNAARLNEVLATLNAQFKTLRGTLKDRYWVHPDAIAEDVADKLEQMGKARARYESACAEYEALVKDTDATGAMTDEDLTALKTKVLEADSKIRSLKEKRKLQLEWPDTMAASNSLTSIFEDLRDLFLEIVEDPDRKYNPTRHQELMELNDKLIASVRVSEEKISTLRHQLTHMESLANEESVECPECDHEWKLGYNKELHENLKKSLETGVEYTGARKKELEEVASELKDSNTYMEQMKQILQTMRYTGALQPLWDLMLGEDMVRKYPRQCASNLEIARLDIGIDLQICALQLELDENVLKVNKAQEAKTDSHALKLKQIEYAEARISAAVNGQRYAQSLLNTAQATARDYKAVNEIEGKIKDCIAAVEKNSCDCVDAIKNDLIDVALNDSMGEIALLTNKIGAIDNQTTLVEDIKTQIELKKKDKAAYEMIVKSLSPVDGLIAEGMLGFIRDYVMRMNAFIDKIWTYPMEVKDCSLEEDAAELNYKFPFSVNDEAPIADVSMASDGQAEVIDLAFRIAASQSLKLDNGPLVLDEFGRAFDEAHRSAATHAVKQIIEELNYSQYLIISHYDASHGSFHKAQMTVIDKRNITIPAGREYNTHTVIEL